MTSSAKRTAGRAHRHTTAKGTLSAFVDDLQAEGLYVFRRDQALKRLRLSRIALKRAYERLATKQRLVMPRRGLFVIVPLEYRAAGAPPPSWFVDDLMAYSCASYYVGLLTAAALHGAGHQQPQEFQVVTERQLRAIVVGRTRMRFFVKRNIHASATQEKKTETGKMRVSTPEGTALDLVRYAPVVGGLGAVAAVLRELAEVMDGNRLAAAAKTVLELSTLQRLGYLLDAIDCKRMADPLAKWVAGRRPRPTPLRSDKGRLGPAATRWSIVENELLGLDE